MFSNKKPLPQAVTVEGIVIRGGFVSFGVELARTEYVCLIKTSTGTQQFEFLLADRLKAKLALTVAGDHVKMVAHKEVGAKILVLQEYYNNNLQGIT